jgi:PAS domain S-box-containing protein
MTSVLVLDDRAADRELLNVVLTYAGYSVREVASGDVALALARSERPELIIADLLMPLMDGYEFVQELRRDPDTAAIPVIFCTATYELDDIRPLVEACGVSHVLVKPAEPDEIIRIVAEVLGTRTQAAAPVATEQFTREHQRVLNAKLLAQVEELERVNAAQQQLHEKLRRERRQTAESLILLETLLRTAPVGIAFVDRAFRIQRMNETLAAMKGLAPEQAVGCTMQEIAPELWPQIEPFYRHVVQTGEAVINQEDTGERAPSDGEPRYGLASYYPVLLDDEIIGVGVILVDVTESHEADVLRSVVMDTMAEGLYVVDGDGRLSLMNAAASAMLGWSEQELSGRLVHDAMHAIRADGSPCAEEDSELLRVRSLGETVRRDDAVFTRIDGTLLPVAYSAAPLVTRSDVRGAVVVFRDYTGEIAERTRVQRELDALSWVGRTRDAIDEDRLVLYSQPIVALADDVQTSEELLLRMIAPDGRLIAPGQFMPAAERYGLIGEIDRWVLKTAIQWAALGRCVEANLSAESITNRELLFLIEDELRATGADPSNLVFELTETALIRDSEAAETFAHAIVKMGCALALDDFGTGFANFTYLKRLPVKFLKIDIEFVRDLPSNPANQHLVKAIISLAQAFGQQTIAEGVENEETLTLLRDYGVDFAQGFHLGRPASISVPTLL